MANNNVEAWSNERVSITDANYCAKTVRFGDLLPILLEKPDVFEAADHYIYDNANSFVTAYWANHANFGYGDFRPDI